MPKRTFEIEWDTPDDPTWLDALSLSLALENACSDTLWTVRYAEAATKQEREQCLAACVAVHQHWSGGLAETRLPEINDRLLGITECIEAIRELDK